MKLHLRLGWTPLLAVIVVVFAVLAAHPAFAVVVDMVDDFQDGTTQGWKVGLNTPVGNLPDVGPQGVGDHVLHNEAGMYGGGKLVVFNESQWAGNWNTTGIERIAFDVRNPSDIPIKLRIGIASGPFSGGPYSGDTYVTAQSIAIPANGPWQTVEFNVLADDFTKIGGNNAATALSNVTQLRILNAAGVSFTGDYSGAFYIDNIHAMGADVGVSGDYNGDGAVDAADYTVWRDNLGQTGTGLAADGTGPGGAPDGVVDTLDYDFWKTNFGNTGGGGHHHGLGAGTSVPEPASLVAFILGISAMALLRDRKERAN